MDSQVIEGIARCARIHLTQEELASMKHDLEEVLTWAAQLEQIVFEDVPLCEKGAMVLRKDCIAQDATYQDILSNAPEKKACLFVAPRVL